MLLGLGVTLYYMVVHSTTVQTVFSWSGTDLWFDIQPISAGVFGVPAGFLAIWIVSLLFPDRRTPQAAVVGTEKSL
jgi:cation/acetate symporter